MTEQSPTLDRSMLERKDRAELQAIATQLGGKPGSRTRKAELVDLVLELAGVAPSTTVPSSDTDSPANGAAPTVDQAAEADDPDETGSSSPDAAVDAPAEVASATDNGDTADNGEAAANGDTDSEDGGASRTRRRTRTRTRTSSATDTDDVETTAAGSAPSVAETDEPDPSGHDKTDDRDAEKGGRSEPRDQSGREDRGGSDRARHQKGNTGKGDAARSDTGKGHADRSDTDNADRSDTGKGGSKQGGRDRDGSNKGGSNQGGRDRDGSNKGGANRNKNNDRNNDGGDDVEPGNRRRRRRRGRDRDRDDDQQGQGGQQQQQPQAEPVPVAGLLDLRDEGYGFLRVKGALASKDDVYVSVKQARQLSLRRGDLLTGMARPAGRNEKNPALLKIDTVNGGDPEEAKKRPHFEDLTPLFPDSRLNLERAEDPGNVTARIIDLISPIGKGQRGLIVSPPKAGKTTIMKEIAASIETNNPEVELMVLLVDERPEEVTDMRRSLKRGLVIASTFDRPSDEHTQVAELTIERAKRLVEEGKDVVIILDGITRLARAYNLAAPATGRIMSGGIDTGALYPPKRFFGAARNIEEGGSLTILATALVETGSKMDEVIFEEFKGTGNMELRLDRRMAEKRIYPAIDVDASSTRHEELLFERSQLQMVWKLRRVLSGLSGGEGGSANAGLELLIDRLRTFNSNAEFLAEIAKQPGMG
ncbi:MAG: transcription termination factor Rho [Actinomycetia bacterium]|nr:transcription termination factor Rho [Actinomycetes bacterium]